MQALSQLRAATWPIHQQMEKRIDVKARFTNLDRYRAHLARMWGFCSVIESRIESGSVREVLPDFDGRSKVDSLTQDLGVLGLSPLDIQQLPRCNALPHWADVAAELGCLYVMEGASLGGRTLMPVVARHLGFDARRGAAFLATYGSEVDEMWGRFGVALEAWCSDAPRRDSATAAAVATFESLEEWLCAETASTGV